MNDLKFAFRQVLKHKGSSLLAALLLALGIGGTTKVFSVADKVLLNPIPGRNGDRLITLREVDVERTVFGPASGPFANAAHGIGGTQIHGAFATGRVLRPGVGTGE